MDPALPLRPEKHRRRWLWKLALAFVSLISLLFVATFFIDGPLTRQMERNLNRKLKGYSVQLAKAHFQLIGLSITLQDLTIRQQANPDPPVARLPRVHASVHWRELLSGHLVADFLFEKPRLHLNLAQLRKEANDGTKVKDRGWQDALFAIYPLKVNQLRVRDGQFAYIDEGSDRPLEVSHLDLTATNIRNIHSRDRIYPSTVHAEGIIFDTGHGIIDGNADFLAEPFPGIHTIFRLVNVPLDRLRPLSARANLLLKGGFLSTEGEIEYGPKIELLHVKDLSIRAIRIDYIHADATAKSEKANVETVKKAARQANQTPELVLRMDKFELVDSELGMVNKTKKPAYRAFVSGTSLLVTNLSNRFSQGPAHATLKGRFMGSGATTGTATFRAESNGNPDFDLNLAIEGTQMPAMNDILQAYGKFDVSAGLFSFFTELHVKNGKISGYVKPLFKDMKVYDKRKDKDKTIFKKMYEILVGGVATLLENHARHEVVTQADLSGSVSAPNSSTLQVIGRLIENAFFHSILPGFDKELDPFGKKTKKAGPANR